MTTDRGPVGPLTLPFLIQDLCGRLKTGTLALKDETGTKTLYLDSGRVVFAASSDTNDRLGQLFLRRKMIRLKTLMDAASTAAEQNRRIGAVLVQMKAIRPQDLIWGVTEQVRQMVVGLFQWTRGEYAFSEGILPSDEVITLKMHTGDLIMSGIKSIESWSRIEAAVGDLDTRYAASPRQQDLAKELTLSLEEWTLLSQCESGATLGEIAEQSSLGDFEVCRLIWAFMVVGLLVTEQGAAVATAAR
ncbi:MAG TPA: DUF4388 domain-containing protein [Patescibacteria group bacterium]|nr:DUF4388 domain-containing protein [Patescibacteria group bacterium]